MLRAISIGSAVACMATVGVLDSTVAPAAAFRIPDRIGSVILFSPIKTTTTLTTADANIPTAYGSNGVLINAPMIFTAVVKSADDDPVPVAGGTIRFTTQSDQEGAPIVSLYTVNLYNCPASGCSVSVTTSFPDPHRYVVTATYSGSWPWAGSSDGIFQYVVDPDTLSVAFSEKAECDPVVISGTMGPSVAVNNGGILEVTIAVNGVVEGTYNANDPFYFVVPNPTNASNAGYFLSGTSLTASVTYYGEMFEDQTATASYVVPSCDGIN